MSAFRTLAALLLVASLGLAAAEPALLGNRRLRSLAVPAAAPILSGRHLLQAAAAAPKDDKKADDKKADGPKKKWVTIGAYNVVKEYDSLPKPPEKAEEIKPAAAAVKFSAASAKGR
jgi:hypothetical protein